MRLSIAKKIFIEAVNHSFNFDYENDKSKKPISLHLEGSMGIGKTALCRQVAEEMGLHLVIVSLAQFEPTDIGGLRMPDGDSMKVLKPDWIVTDEQ